VSESLAGEHPDARTLLRTGGAGLVLAGLGYSLIALGVSETTAFRMQILSGPGIALFLASVVVAIARRLPAQARPFALVLLGAWLVAVGSGRTAAMQATWDRGSACVPQASLMNGLADAVPDVVPGTLFVLLDEPSVWKATYGFHHAVQFLYARRAAGFVPEVWDALTPARFENDGVRFEPWEVNRAAWDEPATTFPYEHVVVVRHTASSGVSVAETWPGELPPLPEGARYEPRARIAAGSAERRGLFSRLAEVPAYTGR
jgi:hypothetical protein